MIKNLINHKKLNITIKCEKIGKINEYNKNEINDIINDIFNKTKKFIISNVKEINSNQEFINKLDIFINFISSNISFELVFDNNIIQTLLYYIIDIVKYCIYNLYYPITNLNQSKYDSLIYGIKIYQHLSSVLKYLQSDDKLKRLNIIEYKIEVNNEIKVNNEKDLLKYLNKTFDIEEIYNYLTYYKNKDLSRQYESNIIKFTDITLPNFCKFYNITQKPIKITDNIDIIKFIYTIFENVKNFLTFSNTDLLQNITINDAKYSITLFNNNKIDELLINIVEFINASDTKNSNMIINELVNLQDLIKILIKLLYNYYIYNNYNNYYYIIFGVQQLKLLNCITIYIENRIINNNNSINVFEYTTRSEIIIVKNDDFIDYVNNNIFNDTYSINYLDNNILSSIQTENDIDTILNNLKANNYITINYGDFITPKPNIYFINNDYINKINYIDKINNIQIIYQHFKLLIDNLLPDVITNIIEIYNDIKSKTETGTNVFNNYFMCDNILNLIDFRKQYIKDRYNKDNPINAENINNILIEIKSNLRDNSTYILKKYKNLIYTYMRIYYNISINLYKLYIDHYDGNQLFMTSLVFCAISNILLRSLLYYIDTGNIYNIIEYIDNIYKMEKDKNIDKILLIIDKKFPINESKESKLVPIDFDKYLINLSKLITDKKTIGGSNKKYKKTENKITVIYKKKKYTRVIYINERKKYVKINKTFMLLSKLKKI